MTLEKQEQENQSNKEISELKQKKLNCLKSTFNLLIVAKNLNLQKMRNVAKYYYNYNIQDSPQNIGDELELTEEEKKLLSEDIQEFNKTDFNFEDIETAHHINHEKNKAINNVINKFLSKLLVNKYRHHNSDFISIFIERFQNIGNLNEIISNSFIPIYFSMNKVKSKLSDAQMPLITYIYSLNQTRHFVELLPYIINNNLNQLKIKLDENNIPNDKENSSLFLSSSREHLFRASQANYSLIKLILAKEEINSKDNLTKFIDKLKEFASNDNRSYYNTMQTKAVDDLHSLLQNELEIKQIGSLQVLFEAELDSIKSPSAKLKNSSVTAANNNLVNEKE